MSKSARISEHVSETSGKSKALAKHTTKLTNKTGKELGMETYDDDDASGIEKYIREESPKKNKSVKTAALTDAVDSDCECKPNGGFEPCGIPDDASIIHAECDCEIDCEHQDINKQSKGKKAKFDMNVAPFENTGQLQSPIDIISSELVVKKYPALEFSSMYFQDPDRMYTVGADTYEVFFKYTTKAAPQLSGGPLTVPYKFIKFQFHWGAEDDKGSEHTIDGMSFKMELHAIHIQEQLTKKTAQTAANGYAILGYFFELGETDNPAVATLLENFANLDQIQVTKKEKPSLDVNRPFAVGDLMNVFSESYITYQGSLTHKPYSENVTWILAPYSIRVSGAQMALFRSLKGVQANNFREVQDRHNRVVNIAERDDNIFGKSRK